MSIETQLDRFRDQGFLSPIIWWSLRQWREDEPSEKEVDERYAWRPADKIRETLPEKMQLYYDRWRSLQLV